MRASIVAVITIFAAPAVCAAQPAGNVAGWTSAGNGPENTRNSATEHKINAGNVGQLAPAWTLTTQGEVPDTPTIDGKDLYTVDSGGSVWKVDTATGSPLWKVSLPALSGVMGANSRTSPAIAPTAIIIGDQAKANVYAISKSDGTLLWKVKLDSARGAIITTSPVVVGNQILVGVSSNQEELAATIKNFVPDFRGSVVALDLSTGKVLWQYYTVPQGYTGGAVWGSNLAVDVKRNTVFAGTGDNYSVPPQVAACQAAAHGAKQLDACLSGDDHIDSILALDLTTGLPKWTRRMTVLDTWTVSCLESGHAPKTPCPQPTGLDYDFASGPNLFTSKASGGARDLVGAGQKSGVYWALDRDTGHTVWATQVNPGGTRGGIEWGSAVDGARVFVAASNANYVWTQLAGTQKLTDGGFWSALDINTGKIQWQTATTAKQPLPAARNSRTMKPPPGATARTEAAVSVANGVMYGSDAAGDFVALNASTGEKLWSYQAQGAAVDAPSVVNGMLFWGDGYGDIGPTSKLLYAFGLPK